MKKIINSTENAVREMCHGIVMANPHVALDSEYKIIYRKNDGSDKVRLISGGGSGHEPAHTGYVGRGMLDAAVCGDFFASPSQIQIYRAIKKLAGEKGVLLIIKNYSGDVMNFKNAAYLASEDGIRVDYVIVDDDIAVQDSLYTVGRRGVAGTVFVHKIAGAAAEKGMSLEEVKRIATKAASNVRSIGFALSSCTVPAKGSPTFEIGDDEMEYGVGIHGEPGIKREKIKSADELAQRMVKELIEEIYGVSGSNRDKKADRKAEERDKSKNRIAVMINGFGGTPSSELYMLNSCVARELDKYRQNVVACYVGNYMTSLDMAGASVSVIKLDDELEELLNEPSYTSNFMVAGETSSIRNETIEFSEVFEKENSSNECISDFGEFEDSRIKDELTIKNMTFIIRKISDVIIKNEVPFCEMDSHAGDGDFGMSVAKGFRQLKRQWKKIINESADIGTLLQESAMVIMEYCGGASGPIWGSAFRAAGKSTERKNCLDVMEVAQMLREAVNGIQRTGERSFGRGAVVGDKTLIDALVPCADKWSECAKNGSSFRQAFEQGALAAEAGAENTKKIVARMGRAGTVGDRSIGFPDAGAYALGVIFKELYEALKF